jgi:serine/threonine protein kinase
VIEQARANKMEGYTQAVDVWSLGVILYILLAGYPPFGPKDFEDILRAKFDFKHDRWKSVSESAKQLIRRMLAREPAERATIDQIVNDPWLQGVVRTKKKKKKEQHSSLKTPNRILRQFRRIWTRCLPRRLRPRAS